MRTQDFQLPTVEQLMAWVIWIFAVIPVLLLVSVSVFEPQFLTGSHDFSHDSFWSIGGFVVTYLSLFFSLYAVLQIRKISQRQFEDKILPAIVRDLDKCIRQLDELKNEIIRDVYLSGVITKSKAILKTLRNAKVKSVRESLSSALVSVREFEKSASVNHSNDRKVLDLGEFWRFHQALAQIRDEVNSHIVAEKARL